MKFLVFIICTICLGACVAPVSMQSGRTLGEGKMQVAASLSVGRYYSSIYDNSGGNNPVPECSIAFGAAEDLDLILKLGVLSGHITGIGKYQLLGSKTSLAALSVGLEAGISPLTAYGARTIGHASLPLYFSLHPYRNIAFYGSPRYLYVFRYDRISSGDSPGSAWRKESLGLTYGIMYGQDRKFMLELSHYLPSPGQFLVTFGFTGLIE